MRRALAVFALHAVVILGWAAHHERVRASAPTFRLPLEPVDPYDLLRGRYFVLNPVDRRIKTGRPSARLAEAEVRAFLAGATSFDGPALVGFCPEGELHRVCALRALTTSPGPEAGRWSRARVTVYWEEWTWHDGKQVREPGFGVAVDLGLRRFFVPNRLVLPARENERGWEVEVSHRPGLAPLARGLWFRGQPVYRN